MNKNVNSIGSVIPATIAVSVATPHLAGATFEVEDHHVTILNKALKKWKGEKTLNIQTMYNKDALKTGG